MLCIEAIQIQKSSSTKHRSLTGFLYERIHLEMMRSRDDATLIIYLELMHSGKRDSSSFAQSLRVHSDHYIA